MAADSDGDQQNNNSSSTLKAVVICEGNLHDPDFQTRLDCLVAKLTTLVEEPADNGQLKVDKVEPWNSVRVTLSIPKEAAVKLRKLAAEGNSALRALGILSVQLEGDTVLSLRLVGQEIVLRTDNSTPVGPTSGSGASSGLGELTRILSQQQQQQQQQQQEQRQQQHQQPTQLQHGQQQAVPQDVVAGPSKATPPVQPKPSVAPVAPVATPTAPVVNGPIAAESTVFKSPNTICPMDGKLPVHVPNVVESCEYPFESMTQARVIQRRENTLGMVPTAGPSGVSKPPLVSSGGSNFVAPTPPPPPPPSYQAAVAAVKSGPPTASGSAGTSTSGTIGNVAMTSPLLVNLLQNESAIPQIGGPKTASIIKQELITASGVGTNAVKSSVVTGTASNSSVVNKINDNELNVNSSSGQIQKASRLATNSSNNPVNPVISNSGSVTVTVAHTIATAATSNSVTNTQQTILVNNNSNAGVMPMATGTGSGPTISANANTNLSITTNSSNINNTASNNQNVLNVPPSLVTPPMSVPSSHKNVSVQQQQQQQHQPRFNLGPSGAPVVRPSTQHTLRPQLIGVGMVQQQQHELLRPPQQSQQQEQTHSQISLSRFPIQSQHQNVPFRQPQAVQQPQQQQQPFNPRWAAPNPMDSATKSSFQEFTRYQMQYNLSQQQLKHPQQGASATGGDLLGLGDLPDLGKNDLDSLLPAFNSADLDGAFLDGLDLDLEQSLAAAGGLAKPERRWKQQFLINPLTGELEETQVEETEENDEDASKSFPEFHSELSNSLYSDDDTSCSTGFSKFTSDISDTERSNTMDGAGSSGFSNTIPGAITAATVGKLAKPGKVKKEKLKDANKVSVKTKEKKPREKKSLSLKQVKTKAKIVATESGGESPGSQEKIKLRLKLEKSEAVSVSLVQPHLISGGVGGSGLTSSKKVQSSQVLGGTPGTLSGMGSISNPSGLNIGSTSLQASLSASSLSSSSSSSTVPVGNVMPPQLQHPLPQQVLGSTFTGTNNSAGIAAAGSSLQTQSPAGEELRVPPLHISLRGKNSVVIKNSKKDRKKSQSGGEEDSDGNSFQLIRKSSIKRSSHSTDSRLMVVMTSDASIRLKIDDSVSPGTSGPSSMPSSPNHHNHNSIGNSGCSNSLTTTIAAVAGLKAKANKIEDLNQPLTANELLVSLDQQHKRSAPDSILNPNGMMCPEKKRRLSTGSSTSQQQAGTADESSISASNSSSSSSSAATSINEINEIYETLVSNTVSGPIGSTNVGTLPHSSLLAAATSSAKNLKSSSTNNSINNSAFGKCISNSKNLVKPAQSSPTTSSVSSPGALAAAPNTKSSTQSSTKQPSSSPSSETSKGGKLGKGDSDLSTGDTDGKDNESNKTSSNTATTTSGSEVSINQRINNTHLHHHNRPPEKADDSPANTLEQSSQQQPPTIASASGHLLAQGVRGSPGSQAQGEDSGIESMDALSEKSPHQLSHSPQGNEPNKLLRMDSPKEKAIPAAELKESPKEDSSGNNNNNSHTNLDEYIQIEAELAKMEGMNDIATTERTSKLNGDHSTLMKPKQQQLDLLDHNALLKYDGANLSKILDDIEDDELVMSEEAATKEKCIEVSSSENTTLQQQQDSTTTVVKGEEVEDWLATAGNQQHTQNQQQQKQQQQPPQKQQQHQKGEANVILTSNSNNNLTDKAEIKLDTKLLVLDDCCSNKEVLSLKSECDSKIVECKAVIKQDPEEATVSSIKLEQTCNKNSANSSSNGSSSSSTTNISSNPLKSKPVITTDTESDKQKPTMKVAASADKKDVITDGLAAVVEPKPRHEQPPLYSYSSEKARERRSAASFTASGSSNTSVVEIIDLDDSGKSNDLEDPQPEQEQQQEQGQEQEQQEQQQQQNKEIHSPLSIDIPSHPESAEHRIRTRASSKLESPLEPPRQSPSIDSPAAERLKNTLKHAAIASNIPTTTAAASGDRLSPKTLPKAGKRKRQGSESSTQSCVSDDILPSRTKKPRKAAAAVVTAAASTERQKKAIAIRSAQQRRAAPETPSSHAQSSSTVLASTVEDSSDSDEPLIEIAGASSGSSSTIAPASHEKEKTLRNHKASAGAKTSSTSQNSSSSTSSNSVSSGGSAVNAAVSHKSNAHAARSVHNALSSLTSTATVASSNAISTSDDKISTRRSVRMTTSTLSTAAMNSKAKAHSNQNSAGATGANVDNLRDSTHHPAGALHPKNNHANHQHSSASAGGGTAKGSTPAVDGKTAGAGANSVTSITSSEAPSTPVTEVRRKTRSAGLETTTEGRRRRVSRDSK